MPPEAPASVEAVWRSGVLPRTRPRPHAPVDEAGLGPRGQRQEPCLPFLLGRVVWRGEPGAAERSRADKSEPFGESRAALDPVLEGVMEDCLRRRVGLHLPD
eukprot:2079024-Pleurochrysis_carterae.AAC.1